MRKSCASRRARETSDCSEFFHARLGWFGLVSLDPPLSGRPASLAGGFVVFDAGLGAGSVSAPCGLPERPMHLQHGHPANLGLLMSLTPGYLAVNSIRVCPHYWLRIWLYPQSHSEQVEARKIQSSGAMGTLPCFSSAPIYLPRHLPGLSAANVCDQ